VTEAEEPGRTDVGEFVNDRNRGRDMIKTLVLYGCIAAPWLSLDAHTEKAFSLSRNALVPNAEQIDRPRKEAPRHDDTL